MALASAVTAVVIGVALLAIEVRQGATIEKAIGGFAILLAFAAVLLIFQSRSDTVRTLAGDPVDERWRIINEKALAASAVVTSLALLAAFGIAEAAGRENWQFAIMALILSFSYIGALVWHRWRM
jgi:hypothetical protein